MVAARQLPTAAMSNESRAPLSVLDEILCTALAVGLVLVALLPAARGMSPLGWGPLWLVGMPAAALWAARGFALPSMRPRDADAARRARQARRTAPQARRATRPARRMDLRRAA